MPVERATDRPEARYLDPFLDHLRVERGLSEHTITAYASDLRRYLDDLARSGVASPTRAARSNVEAHVATLRRAGRAPTSVARALSSIRTFHRFLVEEGLTAENPTVRLPRARRWQRLPSVLAVEDVLRLLAIPRATPLGIRDRALLEMAYATGLRASELVGLRFQSVVRRERFGVEHVDRRGGGRFTVVLGADISAEHGESGRDGEQADHYSAQGCLRRARIRCSR